MKVECHVSPWMTLNSLNGLAPTNMAFMVLSKYKSIAYSSVCHQKGNKKVRIMTHKAHCLPLKQKALNKDVISLLDLLLHTRRAMCWCCSTFTVLLFFILKKDLPTLRHASLLQGITFCWICKIKFFRLCNSFNTGSVNSFQWSSLTISLEKKLP